jgi:hypothetical protein
MKKVVYYETDSPSPSTSSSSDSSVASKRNERKKYSKMPLRYPRISKRAPLLFVALGKPPYFDDEDYCMWSDKMRHHLTSLHESIWDIVEFGAQVPQAGDKDYDSDKATQIRHFNSQATSILLASLCREEYNKVQGLKSAKEFWDVLKTAHEGDEVTKITKRKTIKGELGRFVLNKGEEPQAMYNWLKTMVNQVRNLGSTKWDDHEMVKVILRSLVFCNPTQVQLKHGDPRYKLMSLEKVIAKFVSFELMIKDSKHIVNLEQGATSTSEMQPVTFKATEEEKREKKRYYKKKGGDAHMCREWDSDESSTYSSSDKDAANITVNKGLLFPKIGHKCFMAKDGKKKKVHSRATPKYTTSSDDGSSSENEDDLLTLFANLSMEQKKNLNELIEAIHEKD